MRAITLIILIFSCLPILPNKQLYNQYDSLGRKDGLWMDAIDGGNYKYYKHGVEDGVYYCLASNNRLYWFGEMKGGKMDGNCYFFDDNRYVKMKYSDFHYEKTLIPKSSHYTIKYADANCYAVHYYANGRIEEEGRLFFFDDDPIIDSGEYGLWNYYDEQGNLIKTVEYK